MADLMSIYSLYVLAYARGEAIAYGDVRKTLASSLGCIHSRRHETSFMPSELAARLREMGAEEPDDSEALRRELEQAKETLRQARTVAELREANERLGSHAQQLEAVISDTRAALEAEPDESTVTAARRVAGLVPDMGPSERDYRNLEEARSRLQRLILADGKTDTGGRWLFDAAADEIVRLRGEVDGLRMVIRAARDELGAQGDEKLLAAAHRVAEMVVELRSEVEKLTTHIGVVQKEADHDGRLAVRFRREAREAREQGAAEMRTRAAQTVVELFEEARGAGVAVLPWGVVANALRGLPLDGAPHAAPPPDGLSAEDAETLRASMFWTEVEPGVWERWGRPGTRWRVDCAADLVGLRAAARQHRDGRGSAEDALSSEDQETLRGAGWKLRAEIWYSPAISEDYDPEIPCDLESLRSYAARHRAAKAPPAASGVTGEAPGGDRAAGGSGSVAEERGEKQGAGRIFAAKPMAARAGQRWLQISTREQFDVAALISGGMVSLRNGHRAGIDVDAQTLLQSDDWALWSEGTWTHPATRGPAESPHACAPAALPKPPRVDVGQRWSYDLRDITGRVDEHTVEAVDDVQARLAGGKSGVSYRQTSEMLTSLRWTFLGCVKPKSVESGQRWQHEKIGAVVIVHALSGPHGVIFDSARGQGATSERSLLDDAAWSFLGTTPQGPSPKHDACDDCAADPAGTTLQVTPEQAAGTEHCKTCGARFIVVGHATASEPTDGPTARDAVAGMLLRLKWDEAAQRLADGAWTAQQAIGHMRAQYRDASGAIPPEDAACIAALEALDRGDLRVLDLCIRSDMRRFLGARDGEGMHEAVDRVVRERDEARASVKHLACGQAELTRQLDEARAEAATLREDVERMTGRAADLERQRDEACKDALEAMRELRARRESPRVELGEFNVTIKPGTAPEDVARILRDAFAHDVAPLRPAEDIARELVKSGVAELELVIEDDQEAAIVMCRKNYRTSTYEKVVRVLSRLIARSRVEGNRASVERDAVHAAAVKAVHLFGGDRDGMFSGACFSAAFCDIMGLVGPVDGRIVRGMLSGRRDVEVMSEGYRLIERAPVETPQEAPSGMRIEKREDGEYLTATPAEPDWNCNQQMRPGDGETICCHHLNGEHLAVGEPGPDGASRIIARWPIASAQDEPRVVGVDMGTGPAKVAAVVLRREPSGEVKPIATFESDDAEQKAREYIAGLPSDDEPQATQVASEADRIESADGDIVVEMPKDADPRAVLATVAELLGLTPQDAVSALDTTSLDQIRAHAQAFARSQPELAERLWSYARGVEMGERRARAQAESRTPERELGNPAVLMHWADRTPEEIAQWAEEAEGDNPRHASWCRGVAAGIREGERRAQARHAESSTGTPDREALGRAVYSAFCDIYARDNAANLRAWDARGEEQRERDRFIGERLFALGVAEGERRANEAWQRETGVASPEDVKPEAARCVNAMLDEARIVAREEGERRAEEKARATARELVQRWLGFWQRACVMHDANPGTPNAEWHDGRRCAFAYAVRSSCDAFGIERPEMPDDKPPTGGEPAPVEETGTQRAALNAFAKSVASEAKMRGHISNDQMHEIDGIIDRRLWPENYRGATTPDVSEVVARSATADHVEPAQQSTDARWQPGAAWESLGTRRLSLCGVHVGAHDMMARFAGHPPVRVSDMTPENGWRYVSPASEAPEPDPLAEHMNARVDREEASAIERAHADGIVEGLSRAGQIMQRLADRDRLGALDAHEAVAEIDKAIGSAMANVASADRLHVDRAALPGSDGCGWPSAACGQPGCDTCDAFEPLFKVTISPVERAALLDLATGWASRSTSLAGGSAAFGLGVAAEELRRLLDAPRAGERVEAPREPTLDDLAQRFRREAEGQGRERAQDLAERWRRRASNPAAPSTVTAALEVCAFELADEFGLDPEGAAHEPAAAPDLESLRAALRREADAFAGLGVLADERAQENEAALRRAAGTIESERDAHLVLAVLGFDPMSRDRVLGTSPPAAQDGSSEPHGSSGAHSADATPEGKV